MIYPRLRRLHPWIGYFAAVVLMVTGFQLLMEGQWVGVVQLAAGVAVALARVGSAQHRTTTDRE